MTQPKTILSAAIASVLCASPAAAQVLELEEIVVTARKAEERLQDVPLAVTAFTADAIEQAGIVNMGDVAAQTPGLIFFSAFGDDLPTPVIRGVTQTQIFGENNVALFVDGAYVSGRAGVNFAQLDIERIEVVKGPQSAMYGRGSFSGAINVITAKPTDTFEGKVTAMGGQDGTLTGKLVLSGPLTDRIKGRVALGYDQWDGSYENQNKGGPEIGGYEHKTFDGSLMFTPSESLSILLKGYYSDDQNYSPAMSQQLANCEPIIGASPATSPQGRPANFCGTLKAVDTDSLAVIDGAKGQAREVTRANLSIDWQVGSGSISAITGYSDVKTSAYYDASRGSGDESIPFIYQSTTGGPGTNAVLWTGLLQDDPEDSTQEFSQEIRYTSDPGRRVRYSVGGYYWTADTTARGNRPFSTQPLPADFRSFLPIFAQLPFPPYTVFFSLGDAAFLPWFGETQPITKSTSTTDSYSAFGHVEADFTDKLTGRVELRYSDEKDKVVETDGNSASDSWGFTTGRASLTWKPVEEGTFYLAVARGVKSGGFDYVSDIEEFFPYEPEKLWSYELGMKAEMLDGRAFLDVAFYYMDWDDIIIPNVVEVEGQPVAVDTNAGTAESKGFEIQYSMLITERLSLGLGYAWNDAKYTDAQLTSFEDFPSFAPDGDVSGNQLLRQSKIQWNANLAYRAPLFGDWEWYGRVDANYQSKQYVGADNQGVIPERTVANARFGIESGRYKFELWGLNVLDEDAPVTAFRDVVFSNSPDGQRLDFFPWRLTVTHPERQRFGITASVSF